MAKSKLMRFTLLCLRCKTITQHDRLWNWADHQPDTDVYYAMLRLYIPLSKLIEWEEFPQADHQRIQSAWLRTR